MFTAVLATQLTTGPLPVVAVATGVVALAWLLARRPVTRWLPRSLAAGALGTGVGYLAGWILGDVLDVFGVTPSLGSRTWFALALGAVAVAVLRLVTAPRRRGPREAASVTRTGRPLRWVAAICVPLFVLVGAVGVNADTGEYPTLAAVVGKGYPAIELPAVAGGAGHTAAVAPSAVGRVGSVTIPATTSGFDARSAVVYLPPVALVRHPPKLPVLVMMSGQPGGPDQVFRSGRLVSLLDAYARAHHGYAPIVVSPDQLGAPDHNPMCVDSPLGNSAGYITTDVTAWIGTHLNVLPGRESWAVGGFSQGGTCAIQFGAGHPDLYGNILDIAGEVAPANGSLRATVDRGFGGSDAAYRAATPAALLAAHAPYSQTVGVFVAGSLDSRFGPGLATVAAAAQRAGIDAHTLVSPGTAHDWYTVAYGFRHALDTFGERWGFDA